MAGMLGGRFLVGDSGHGLAGRGFDLLLDLVLLGGSIVLFAVILRRRRAALARAAPTAAGTASDRDALPGPAALADLPVEDPAFDRGIRDIRRLDPGFDPTRFAGYAEMTFRDAQSAWTSRDIAVLRDRVTPEMYVELRAGHDRLRRARQSNHVEQIEIQARITEAWQEGSRDYVTASITGSTVDYTVDDVSHALVAGLRTVPGPVDEFWTFTRPAGLNFWMLSAIQAA